MYETIQSIAPVTTGGSRGRTSFPPSVPEYFIHRYFAGTTSVLSSLRRDVDPRAASFSTKAILLTLTFNIISQPHKPALLASTSRSRSLLQDMLKTTLNPNRPTFVLPLTTGSKEKLCGLAFRMDISAADCHGLRLNTSEGMNITDGASGGWLH